MLKGDPIFLKLEILKTTCNHHYFTNDTFWNVWFGMGTGYTICDGLVY